MIKTELSSSGQDMAALLRDIFGRRTGQRFGSVEELLLDRYGGRSSSGRETIWLQLEPHGGR